MGPRVRIEVDGWDFGAKELSKLVPLLSEARLTEDLVEESRVNLEEDLKDRGHRDVAVSVDRKTKGNEKHLVLHFRVAPGPKFEVAAIEIEGLQAGSDAEVRARFASETAFLEMLARNGLSEDELRATLRRLIGVAQYLEQRFRPLTFVTEEQIEIYYRDELLPSVEGTRLPELSEVSESIRRILEERAFNARVEEWIDGLKGRTRIRRYVW